MTATPANQDENPFAPGFGGLLEHDSKPPIVLTGPRGVGKTLLLTLMEERAKKMEIPVTRLEHVKDLKKGDAMGRLLKEVARGVDKELLKKVKGFNASIPGFGLDLKDDPADGFAQLLQARLSQGPMALLMDEAHHYQAKYMGLMLQVGQRLISQRYPLVILLAGTPDLPGCLMNIEATFMTRSEDIYINLLATGESKEALSEPFANRGIEVEPQALEMIWDMTDNYPYFVQLVGSEVWNSLPEDGKRRVDVALVAQAQERIGEERKNFYNKIYAELHKGKLTSHALCAAETIMRQQEAKVEREVIEHDLQQKNSDLSEDAAMSIVDQLKRIGFIWQPKAGRMEAGILSFFTYLQAKKQQAETENGG